MKYQVSATANRKRLFWGGYVILGLLLVALPHLLSVYHISLVGLFLISALFAVSYNLLLGYAGLFSFGHAIFFGIGAYTLALLNTKADISFLACLPLSIIMSAVAALIIGIICLRSTHWYFAILTLALGEVFYIIAVKWWTFTGGDDGIKGMRLPSLLKPIPNYYYLVLILVSLSIWVIWRITNSPFGYTLRAIRDNPERGRAIGLNMVKLKLMTFVIAGGFAGLAGAISAPLYGITNPSCLGFLKSTEPVVMSLLGGQYVFGGPIVGAVLYTPFQFYISKFTIYWGLFIGLLLVTVVLFLPGGVVGYAMQRFSRLGRPKREGVT